MQKDCGSLLEKVGRGMLGDHSSQSSKGGRKAGEEDRGNSGRERGGGGGACNPVFGQAWTPLWPPLNVELE